MEPRTEEATDLMKFKVKTLGNTVYDLEMKPDVSCQTAPMTLARMHSRMRFILLRGIISCIGVAPNIAALLSEETCTLWPFQQTILYANGCLSLKTY